MGNFSEAASLTRPSLFSLTKRTSPRSRNHEGASEVDPRLGTLPLSSASSNSTSDVITGAVQDGLSLSRSRTRHGLLSRQPSGSMSAPVQPSGPMVIRATNGPAKVFCPVSIPISQDTHGTGSTTPRESLFTEMVQPGYRQMVLSLCSAR